MILHIPHSSSYIPLKDGYVNESLIHQETQLLTDWYTDDLFEYKDAITVKADFSRIFCDVERFPDDKDEVMAEFGMGVCYTQADNGKKLRSVSIDLREKILKEYYWNHHKELDKAVQAELIEKGHALILDCHSFPDNPFKRDLNQNLPRPDINIGTDSFHTPTDLIDKSIEYFESNGFTVYLDEPYEGTIVPSKYYQKNSRVHSIMLEVNRRLYLDAAGSRNENFMLVKHLIEGYMKLLNLVHNNR